MRRDWKPAARGFTLVELLVAIAMLALIGAMSYRAVSSSVEARDRIYVQNEYWRTLSRFFLQFEDDVLQSVGRAARGQAGEGQAGEGQAGFVGNATLNSADGAQLLLARASSAYQGDAQAAARVGYRLAEDRLERLYWPVADSAPGQAPRVQLLLSGVSSVRLQYMNEYSVWRPTWPFPQDVRPRPNAVEIALTLASGESITRLFSLK